MKRLFYLVVIIALPLIVFFQYQNWRRFHPPTDYEYAQDMPVDQDYFDPQVVRDYYTSIQQVGTYARYCWSEHGIDVRFPDMEDPEEVQHAETYQRYITSAKYLESKLTQSLEWKAAGYSNTDIKQIAERGMSPEEIQVEKMAENDVLAFRGNENSLVYEIQRMLKGQGYQLPVDGIFRDSTELCVRMFQEKHEIYPSGVVDKQTLTLLLSK